MSIKDSKIKKAIDILKSITGIEISNNDESEDKGTDSAIDKLLMDECESVNIIDEESAGEAGEMLIQDINDRAEEFEDMSDGEKSDAIKTMAQKRIEQVKLQKKISKAIKSMSSGVIDGDTPTDIDEILKQDLQSILDILDDDEWGALSEKLLSEMNAGQPTQEGVPVVKSEKLEEIKKLLDPSKAAAHVKVDEAIDKIKVEKNTEKGELKLVNQLVDEVETMAEKTDYNNYNSLEIGDVNLQEPTAFWNNLRVPANSEAYRLSKVRIEADDFIKQLIKQIRLLKKHNNEDKDNKLRSGKKICRRDMWRKDLKIFEKKVRPEEEEKDLTIYVALDFSGSTCGGLDKQIATVGLAIIESLEALNIMHTVMAYEGDVSIIKRGKKRNRDKWALAADGVTGMGGNNEFAVFKTTEALFAEDNEKDGVLIIITDGDGCGEESGLKSLMSSIDINDTFEVHSVGLNYDGGSYSLERAKGIYGADNAHIVMNKKDFGKTIAEILKSVLFK